MTKSQDIQLDKAGIPHLVERQGRHGPDCRQRRQDVPVELFVRAPGGGAPRFSRLSAVCETGRPIHSVGIESAQHW